MDLLDGSEDFGWGRLLDQIAAGARLERLKNEVVVFVRCEHQHRQVGCDRFEFPHTVDAGEARKVNIHQDNVGFFVRDKLESGLGAAVGAHATKTARPVNQRR